MTVCNRCGKENQDHYKFCLGCGAELTAPKAGGGDVAMMKTMMADPSQQAAPGAPPRKFRSRTAACPACLRRVRSAPVKAARQDRWVAIRTCHRWVAWAARWAGWAPVRRDRNRWVRHPAFPDSRPASRHRPRRPPVACAAAHRAVATCRRRFGSAARVASAWMKARHRARCRSRRSFSNRSRRSARGFR
jgi:hypothetical protein